MTRKKSRPPQSPSHAAALPARDVAALLSTALAALQAGDLSRAQTALQQLQQAAPENPDVFHMMGLLHMRSGDMAAAAQWLSRAVAARPDHATYRQNYGSALLSIGKIVEAEAQYRAGMAAAPTDVGCRYNLGILLQNTARGAEALSAYEGALAISPNHLGSLNNLGTTLMALGRHAEAEAALRRALAAAPKSADTASNLGYVLHRQGRLTEAEMMQRQALTLAPDNPGHMNNLGNTLMEQGQTEEALALYTRAVALAPDNATILDNMGTVLDKLGRGIDALIWYDRVLARFPQAADTHYNRANALRGLGRESEAIAGYKSALALNPHSVEALNNLGNAYKALGLLQDAEASFTAALRLRPDLVEAQNNLGIVRQLQGRLDEATAAFTQALALQPAMPQALNNRARALQMLGRMGEAEAGFREAIAIKPDYAEAWSNLGSALMDKGEIDEADAACRRALELRPDLAVTASNRLFMSNYRADQPPLAQAATHRHWAELHAPDPGTAHFADRTRAPERPLRIGFLSPDFRWHSVAFFFDPLLDAINRREFSVHLYAEITRQDDMTERLRARANSWTPITGLSDEDAAGRIFADEIDILIDLAGHSSGNRLGVLARRPAPVQATWLGYPNTTGLPQIDWRIVDADSDPEGSESLASERLLRLPAPFLCYRGPADAPPVSPLPARQNGHLTFGSFNALPKTSPEVAEVWAEILTRLPDSHLLLKSKALADPAVRAEKLALFRARGIDDSRIRLVGQTPSIPAHLASYGHMDIGLDPFPYNGTTTTCEALWMGVPVITLAGDRHAGRVGTSLMRSVNLEAMVASDPDDYVRRALSLASDLDRLAKLRSILRRRTAASPLCDVAGFGTKFGTALRHMWHDWCARAPA
jgi:protein O-GlcNAc transferase